MNDQYYDFGEKLQDAISRMNLPVLLSEEQKRSFYIFYQDLVEKNKVMNLTSITDEKDVILKHFADSIALILAVPDLKEKTVQLCTAFPYCKKCLFPWVLL